MQETININRIGGDQSCYRLRREPVKLFCKEMVGCVPCGDGWEPVWDEEVAFERQRTRVASGLTRKQKAAQHAIPHETIKKVTMNKPVPREVAIAIFEDRTEQEKEVARLEAEIRRLLGLVRSKG